MTKIINICIYAYIKRAIIHKLNEIIKVNEKPLYTELFIKINQKCERNKIFHKRIKLFHKTLFGIK